MFMDQVTDLNEVDLLFKSFVNTAHFVMIDLNVLTVANYLVRKYEIEAQPL